MEIFILFILGILGGVIAGIFGLGGGILFTPILFIVFNNAGIEETVLLTIGSSLFCTFIASIGSTFKQYQQQNLFLSEGLKVGILGIIGVSLGNLVATSPFYSKEEFVIFFSLLLIYVSYMFFRRGSASSAIKIDESPLQVNQSAVTGGLGGFVAALAGIGGGGVMVPLMNLYYKKGFSKSVSISSFAIILISFSGWVQLAIAGNGTETMTPYHLGYVDFGAALPLALGGLIGGFAGAYFNMKIDRRVLQYSFSILAIVMAIRMLSEAYF